CILFVLLFFFSSRRRHTRFSRDWSSDVCSSDLVWLRTRRSMEAKASACGGSLLLISVKRNEPGRDSGRNALAFGLLTKSEKAKRSEERRVGKEWRSRWSPQN